MQEQLHNLEIWGGIECTINRIGDTFRDQLDDAGYYERKTDLDEIAKLGIKALRFPVLWEAHQRDHEDEPIDWSRTKKDLETIRNYGIQPIAGLLHHGSGPKFTSLYDNDFPRAFANYARKVASEFPWIEFYTPVNEPLTTARFSGLYGYWFPHHTDEMSFIKILLNQLKAIVLAMKEIRKINPNAKLVQTEDLGKTHSTRLLKYQADFENKRRWLTYDILCGKLNKKTFFWYYLLDMGVKESTLRFFIDNPCPPDIAGFNYYVTSERFLDENTERYPAQKIGRNATHSYADVEAVRVKRPSGLKCLLTEAWERFHLPIALTEVHLHCTREEQMRWFKEAWDTCRQLKSEGIDVRAITAWSLLGAFDWNSLLTKKDRVYENGVFDITGNKLRTSAMTKLISGLANSATYNHPIINEKGWWHKSYLRPVKISCNRKTRPILILHAQNQLGDAFLKICNIRGIPCVPVHLQTDETVNKQILEKAIDDRKPWAIVNAAFYGKLDDAEDEKDYCFLVNAQLPGNVAAICNRHGIQLITFSSDQVFDGQKNLPYLESDKAKPLNVYGKSKAKGENLVLKNYPSSLIIRSSAFFGPWDKSNFAFDVLSSLKQNRSFRAVDDITISLSYLPDLVNAALNLLIDEETEIWHLSNDGNLSWFDFATELASRSGEVINKIMPCKQEDKEWKAQRPGYSALKSEKGIKLPLLSNAIDRFFEEKIC